VLLQLAGTLNTHFNYREDTWHSLLKHLKCWRKSCAKFDSLLLNIQDATVCSLEKVNLKFKLLSLLNHMSYFNKICRIWIVVCKLCKFGKYICYNSRDNEFFLRVPFLARPVDANIQKFIKLRADGLRVDEVCEVLQCSWYLVCRHCHVLIIHQ